jgi:soluble lytic murein transglycosylase-like protein
MAGGGARALAGGMAAAAAFAAVVAFPAALSREARVLAPSEHPPPVCTGLPCAADAAQLVDRIDAQLHARMPQLEDLDRRDLARTIVAEARAARIDALLVLALIEVESAFEPQALSGRGARGLMQLRGPTIRREAERSRLAHDDARDPIVNVQAGVRYLRRLLDAFGREEVALMAYNAGPNRILGYIRAGEIPARFHVYPRRVNTELRRLRRSMGYEAAPLVANADVVPAPE